MYTYVSTKPLLQSFKGITHTGVIYIITWTISWYIVQTIISRLFSMYVHYIHPTPAHTPQSAREMCVYLCMLSGGLCLEMYKASCMNRRWWSFLVSIISVFSFRSLCGGFCLCLSSQCSTGPVSSCMCMSCWVRAHSLIGP